ncbi:DNA-binding transcriptional MerR regulator [Pseudacidovorax intermedius]|uniref:DNA-binding transcriptional MerR regulator n=1 Tax=Pseudacidovorax intermedius TaxID=433924 RepID=A0A370FN21_9BURK|nr:helix-turn-helix domain-containing protein [Pseudacidovorax intermedius]RDI27214.1 DNA-binding transcriptional MerR regulator [Pseudacidovorax intermedius]
MVEMDIAEVGRRAGLPASTLRFYEEKGLIVPLGRRGLRRVYDAGVLQRLSLIALGRVAGFSLEEIRTMLGGEGQPRIDRGRLTAQADLLEARIRHLRALRDGLRHAAECPAQSHLECATFQRLLTAAGSGRLGPRRRAAPAAPL